MTLYRVTKGVFHSADGKKTYGKGSKVPGVPKAVADFYGMVPVEEPKPESEAEVEQVDFDDLTVSELKDLAREQDIEGYSSMKKAELVAALGSTSGEGE